MYVKFLQSIASATFSYPIRCEVDLDDEQAEKWIASGVVEKVVKPVIAKPKPVVAEPKVTVKPTKTETQPKV